MVGWASFLLLGVAAGLSSAFAYFGFVSLREGERRATRVSFALATVTSIPMLVLAALGRPYGTVGVALIAVVGAAVVAVWHWPVGRRVAGGGRPSRRVDERDIMFARARLRPGSAEYEAYYEMRPEHRAGDDRTRSLPGLLSPDADEAEPVAFATADACFEITEQLRLMVDGDPADKRQSLPAGEWIARIKAQARSLGAVDVGVTRLQPFHVYSHVGRGTGRWGEEIELDHPWAIAFTVEMEHGAVACAPGAPVIEESARQYVELSRIGVELASVIRRCGYSARAHTDGNYRVIAPLVARDAGLGEIGRMGLLMTPRLGPRVRIGVVTTALPLVEDPAGDDLSVLDFCTICKKCATNCPVSAIPSGERESVDGGSRWRIDADTCFRYWNVIGTDCAVCMRVCPYSHPDSAAHNLVRWANRRSGGIRRVMLWADDLFYGRRPPRKSVSREQTMRAAGRPPPS